MKKIIIVLMFLVFFGCGVNVTITEVFEKKEDNVTTYRVVYVKENMSRTGLYYETFYTYNGAKVFCDLADEDKSGFFDK